MVKQSKHIEKAFACRVYGAPFVLIDRAVIAKTLIGIKKRIVKEQNFMNRSVDETFIAKKKENLRKLRIIRDEMKALEKQL
jgi:hypothetical protein